MYLPWNKYQKVREKRCLLCKNETISSGNPCFVCKVFPISVMVRTGSTHDTQNLPSRTHNEFHSDVEKVVILMRFCQVGRLAGLVKGQLQHIRTTIYNHNSNQQPTTNQKSPIRHWQLDFKPHATCHLSKLPKFLKGVHDADHKGRVDAFRSEHTWKFPPTRKHGTHQTGFSRKNIDSKVTSGKGYVIVPRRVVQSSEMGDIG